MQPPRYCLGRIALILAVGLSSPTSNLRADDDDLAKELPRIAGLEPDAALKSFKIHPGFRLKSIATEPLVTDPVSVCYDADGALYVVEMRGYPYPENSPTGYVKRLVDKDGDGVFDQATTFLPDLSWPTSVVPWDGGVFVAVPPMIIYAKDTDGDGISDIRKSYFRGFGIQNVQGLVNGLLWGPDGWIYGVSGGNGGDIENLVHPENKPVSVRGRDFRFKPDGSAFEAISGGGQFGHSFDDWGHRFTCNNSNHIRQIVIPSRYLERNPSYVPPSVILDIAAEGAAAPVYRISKAEPWRIVRTRQRAADPEMRKRLPPTELFVTGFFTSATGVTIYRGDAYPVEYQGNAFIGDVGANLVHRKTIRRNGSTFLATRADANEEFLASTDNWFRPVNFTNTPNGTLLILDMYRETIEHPFSIPEPIKKHLDLTSGKDRGRLYELLPEKAVKQRHPHLQSAGIAELVKELANPAAWYRETAQRLLIERGDVITATPLLRDLAKSRPTPLARFHALSLLDIFDTIDDSDLLEALDDPEPNIREHAIRLSERRLKPDSELTGRCLEAAEDPDAMVRLQLALSLGGLPGDKATSALATIASAGVDDPWTIAAVLSSSAGRPADLLVRLIEDKRVMHGASLTRWIDELAILIGAESRDSTVESILVKFAKLAASPRTKLLVGVGLGRERAGLPRQFPNEANAPQLQAILEYAMKTAEGSEANQSIAERIDAIRLLGYGPAAAALKALPDRLDAKEPVAVQLAAVDTLSKFDAPEATAALIEHFRGLSPSVRREAIEGLFSRPERITAVLSAIEAKSIAANDIEPARRKTLIESKDPSIRERAGKLLGTQSRQDRAKLIGSFQKALTLTGNRDAGHAVYKKLCATCHRAAEEGVDVGPNMATVTGRSPEDLLTHILDPNREVAPGALVYNVETQEGTILTGIIAEESPSAITLKRGEGVVEVVPRTRVASVVSTGLSLMPEGLERDLNEQGAADLIAWIRGLGAKPKP